MVKVGPNTGELPTLVGEGQGATSAFAPRVALPARYADLGVVGTGAFGEVRRVRDVTLDRVLVLKLLHLELSAIASVRWRFSSEVRVTAALQHPGVVPVYDHGELPDGRLWYAMKEVRGTTFAAIFAELHAASTPAGFGATASAWTFRRVVDAFARVVQTVAYAHQRGVVHRDLKPENLMAGEFGEVLVMDWGLARRVDQTEPEPAGASTSGERSSALTQYGDVLGTPAYMPPEQAQGARDLHGPPSDVYALGAILYHLLAGRPPYEGEARAVVVKVLTLPPPPIDDAVAGGPPVPDELKRACEHAMQRDADARCTAEGLAGELHAWLDGVRRREQALAALEAARATEVEMNALRAQAERATQTARAMWATLHAFDAIDAKRPAWALEDEADAAGRAVALAEAEWLQGVHGALSIDPDLPEAHEALADHYRAALVAAERERRTLDAARAEAMLRVPSPVVIERDGCWQSAPPGGVEPWPVPLPAAEELAVDDVYVPGSWAWLGGDPHGPDSLPRKRVWIDGFVMKRDPVTVEEYVEFLNDLVVQGREDEAMGAMPRQQVAIPTLLSAPIELDASGRFVRSSNPQGVANGPVVLIDWYGASAYARWQSERTGARWRLPDEYEREKAARGADGRTWPWGDYGEATFACVLEGQRDAPARHAVDAYPLDESLFGVRGLAGNVRDWCANVWAHDGPRVERGRLVREIAAEDDPEFRALRGGFYGGPTYTSRAAGRFGGRPTSRWSSVGMRLVRG